MSTGVVVTLIIVWILALGVAISTLLPIAANFSDYEFNYYQKYHTKTALQHPAIETIAVLG